MNEIVWIDDVECFPPSERIAAAYLDSPSSGTAHELYELDLVGWVVGRTEPVRELHVMNDGWVIAKIPVETPRADVAASFPNAPGSDQCGFEGAFGLLGSAPSFELRVRAVFEDETGIDFASLRGRQRFPKVDFAPTIRPLMVTSLGRTGTTLLLKVLAQDPAIVVHDEYPYETRAAGYWMHMLKVLADPARHARSSHPDSFHDDLSWVGHHPFHCEPLTSLREMRHWFGRDYVEELGRLVQGSVESFYSQLAQAQGKDAPAFFAEKWHASGLPWIVWSMYPEARELFLIRDPRDIVCSILTFNMKRGYPSFGSERYESDEAFIEGLRVPFEHLVASWRMRQGFAHMIRYEDLVQRPIEVLTKVFAYLDLDTSTAAVKASVTQASIDVPELDLHRTSRNAASSVGRWRSELNPGLREICEASFADFLTEFGYGGEFGYDGEGEQLGDPFASTSEGS